MNEPAYSVFITSLCTAHFKAALKKCLRWQIWKKNFTDCSSSLYILYALKKTQFSAQTAQK